MGRSGCFDQSREYCAYSHCLAKFRDENGNPSTIKTTTATPIATTDPIVPTRGDIGDSLGLLGGKLAVYVGAGSGGFVVLCFIVILILCRSRNAEKHKRRIIEEDYRVVATTLTNVNDSDGTTYEELCIDNPHYNRHQDVQLPYKKERKRLPGVSNAVNETFKRWVSVDANQPTANTSKALMQASNKPLPPIPDSNSKTLPSYKQAASAKLSQSIDEYTEIGTEVKRRSNVYNPLDTEKFGQSRDSHGTYESLRASKMMDIQNNRPPIGLPAGEYFTLAKEDDDTKPVPMSPGEYMVLAKEEKDENSSENKRLLPSTEMVASNTESSEMAPYAESAGCLIEDEADSGICDNGGLKNDYYILEKNSDNKGQPESSDYIEPVKGDRHSYMQVLPEHAKASRKKLTKN